MLSITIKVGQSLQVGESTIHCVSRDGNNIRIAIEAPKSLPILRDNAKKDRCGLVCTT